MLHLMAGSKEDSETVSAFFQDMRGRGLGDPLQIASDGAPWHRQGYRNMLPQIRPPALLGPSHAQSGNQGAAGCMARFQGTCTRSLPGTEPSHRPRPGRWASGPTSKPTTQAPSHVPGRFRGLHRPSENAGYPPPSDRTTNLLERLFVEERRRMKIIPNTWGGKASSQLMFAAMTRAADRWKAIRSPNSKVAR